MIISVEREGKHILFKNDGMEFYDIEPENCNGYQSIMSCLGTKQWFTPEVDEIVEALLDV